MRGLAMLARFRPRLTFANVTSLLALLVALGGTAYAAATIGPAQIKNDAVRSRHVKDAEIKNANLGANSVASGKVLNGTLLKQDFKAGQLPPAVPPAEPVRLVKEPSAANNCPAATGEFCLTFNPNAFPPTFRWFNYEEGYAPAGFYKDRSGIVHLQGGIRGSGSLVFILPPGYRPTGGARWFGVWNQDSPSKHGGLKVTLSGAVEADLSTSYLTLDGIQFRP